jgi:hypothetical protein
MYVITKQTTYNEMYTKILVETFEGKRPLRGHNHRWEDIIGCQDVDWIQQAEDRVQWRALINTIMNFVVPYKAGNFLAS